MSTEEKNMKHLNTNDEVYVGHQEKRPKIDGCFEGIPDEVILNIFKNLDLKDLGRCSKVCKRFDKVGHDETLWQKINLRQNNKIPPAFLEYILSRGRSR